MAVATAVADSPGCSPTSLQFAAAAAMPRVTAMSSLSVSGGTSPGGISRYVPSQSSQFCHPSTGTLYRNGGVKVPVAWMPVRISPRHVPKSGNGQGGREAAADDDGALLLDGMGAAAEESGATESALEDAEPVALPAQPAKRTIHTRGEPLWRRNLVKASVTARVLDR